MKPTEIRLVQTCTACPEQYDAIRDGERVGYLRLRHGRFTAQLHDPDGPIVYEAEIGNGLTGMFENEGQRDIQLRLAVNAIQLALEQGAAGWWPVRADMQPIRGGFHVKTLSDGRCIDVMQQIYNWRLVIGPAGHDPYACYEHGWCYFGHGTDADGRPRDMSTAFQAAMLAALAWNGQGTPPGFDKEAF